MIAKEDSPLVSIIVSFLNEEKFLTYTVLSVLNQTYENWELLMLDDGSTDNSLQIARDFEKKDNRIRVYSEGKKGRSGCLNRLVELARGKFLAIIDADDIMVCERLEKQVNFLLNNPEYSLVGGNVYIIDENNVVMGERECLNSVEYKDVVRSGYFVQPSVMGQTDWFRENKYDEKCERMEDYELWVRTFESSHFCNLTDKLIFYRELTGKNQSKYTKSKWNQIKFFYKLYRNKRISIFFCIKLMIIDIFKILIYKILPLIKCDRYFIKMKSKFISHSEKQIADKKMSQALIKR